MPLPPFAQLEDKYPNGTASEVKFLIGGNVNLAWVTNTCVIRISRAMNYAGEPIPRNFAGLNTIRGGDNKRYAFRVAEFQNFMTTRFGQPSVTGSKAGDFAGKTGIIMFTVNGWSDATGHFDLWDGNGCVHKCYFDKASSVSLWEC